MGSDRRIPGEGLAERMGARERRRPRIGMSPAFYTRLGLEDPWAVAGAPEGGESNAGGMVFLSSAPFHAMMRKLAAARRRRDRRQERFAEARAGTTMRAARRSWPGEGKLPTSRISALSLDAMLLPEAPAPAPAVATTVEVEAAAPRPRNLPTPPVADPWRSTPFTPARVARTGSASAHAGARIARAAESVARAGETDSLPLLARSAVARARRRVEVEGEAPAETVEIVRRSRLARPVVRIIEEQLSPTPVAPVARAAARMAPPAAGVARAPAGRSPSIDMASLAAAPTFERAAEFDRAAAGALAAPERGEAMRPQAARRVPPATRAASRSAREVSSPASSLSASPVSAARVSAGRPVAVAPVARTSSVAGAGGSRSATASASDPTGRSASEWNLGATSPRASGSAPRASAAAMARALHAAPISAAVPLLAAPALRRRSPLAEVEGAPSAPVERLVRSATGAFRRPARAGVESTLPLPLGAPVEAAAPSLERAVARAPAAAVSEADETPAPAVASTVRAAMRAQAEPRPGAVTPRAVGSDRAPAPAGVRPLRASAAVQLEGGTFISSRALSALPGAGSVELAARGESPSGPGVARRASPTERPVAGSKLGAPEVAGPAAAVERRLSRAPLRATVASDRQEGPSAWAAERLAPAVQPAAARSALRRPAPELRMPTPLPAVEAGIADSAEAPTPSRPAEARPGAAARRAEPGAAAAGRAPSKPVEAPRAALARKAGSVATAVARAQRAAAAAPEAPAPAQAGSPARRSGQVRRSGPLSWARANAEGQLVASVASGPRVASAARPSPGRPAATAPAKAWTGAPAAPEFVLPQASLPEALAELRDAGLVQASWSPSTPVRTPDGRYVSARVAAAIPGLALLPSTSGPTAVSTLPQSRMAGFRSPEVRFVGAPSARTPEGEFAGAATARTRPTDWVGARSGVTQATAYRGAMGVRTPDVTFAGAGSTTTPTTGFAGARSAVTESGQFVGARTAAGAAVAARAGTPTAAPAGAGTAPARGTARGATRGTRAGAPEALPLSGGRPGEGAEAQAAVIAPRAARPSLESTLASVSEASLPTNAPTWAARSDGAPRVRSAQGLFESLARATTAEQVVGVIAARAGEMSGPVPLTDPMRAVVEQIRQELRPAAVASEGTVLQTRAPEIAAPEATVLRPGSSGPQRSSAIVRSGGTRPVRASATVRGAGGADDRVSKLVKRLTDLIHLAETERRLGEAQAQVRMAEDTAAARAEGSAPVGGSSGQGAKLDIETFAREVLEVVNRELELRRERRTEDGDESNWW